MHAEPEAVASEYTNGRKPTPWTTPSTRIAVRTRWFIPPVWQQAAPEAPDRRARPIPGDSGRYSLRAASLGIASLRIASLRAGSAISR